MNLRTAALGLALIITIAIIAAIPHSVSIEQPKKFDRNINGIMDTTANMEIYEPAGFIDKLLGRSDAEKTMDEIEERWREIESIMSVYDKNSEAYKLNKYKYIENASDELLYVLEQSLYYYNITGGAFDITIKPILELWSSGLWEKSIEEQKEAVERAMQFVGADKVIIKGRSIYLQEGMEVDFGGIGKGYALDEAVNILREHNIESALIRLGGQEYCLGTNPKRNSPWRIGLTNPENTSQSITTFEITNASISTSGNYERYFNPDKSVHHIMDPRTGFSASPCISVTIIAENATAADALSTSVFVLGPEEGMKLVESLSNVEALIIDNNREIYRSSGIDRYGIL
ncbi:MAG: FAD:protein FMN transferase [Candidatus Thermoplasmatota archaeon]|nr:FAD:protein FMN transferase [Candidatus Thermoplasmatota archaeon]